MSHNVDIPAYLDPLKPCFPDPSLALEDPDGLLAIGGNLQPSTLLSAYGAGIFPWFEQGQPPLWWSPGERSVLVPGSEHCSKSMARFFRTTPQLRFTTDQAFDEVIDACAGKRPGASGTWITAAMRRAYKQMHRLGHAHSLECWIDNQLAGGLYGLHIGAVFCGESMFSHVSNSSKACFILLSRTLQSAGFGLIDCQLPNPHLVSLGVQCESRSDFLLQLKQLNQQSRQWPGQSAFATSFAMLSGKAG